MPILDDGIPETRLPAREDVVETDVLIVGTGPGGASAALCLSTLGVKNMVVSKYRWTANSPRAHLTNQRTIEIFRDLGVEEECRATATEYDLIGDTIFCTSLTGDELGRLRSWGSGPEYRGAYEAASPSGFLDLPQHLLEPILVRNAISRGTHARFSTEYLSLTQDEDGVRVKVLDRVVGHEYTIKAKYVIGADGARSKIAADLGLPFTGAMDVGGAMNVTFTADLSHLVAHRPAMLYWVVQPGCDIGGLGLGLVRMVRPWHEWLITWGYDNSGPAPTLDEAEAVSIVRSLVGDPELEVQIQGFSLWGINDMHATRIQEGRVFCVGDAIHRHPPNHGLGSNTSIQDSYNLAWKLAAVLKGQAGARLLDTYDAERAPVAEQIVRRANSANRDTGQLVDALGLGQGYTSEQMRAALDNRLAATASGAAQREAIHQGLWVKNREFNANGTELGQVYRSGAVVAQEPIPGGERSAPPDSAGPDPEIAYVPTTRPGARLPHAVVGNATRTQGLHDLIPYSGFAVITGLTGAAWAEAAAVAGAELGVEVMPIVIGPGQEVSDLYFTWARHNEIAEDGVVLVRPDKHVAFRAHSMVPDPRATLTDALRSILHRGPEDQAPAVSGTSGMSSMSGSADSGVRA